MNFVCGFDEDLVNLDVTLTTGGRLMKIASSVLGHPLFLFAMVILSLIFWTRAREATTSKSGVYTIAHSEACRSCQVASLQEP